MNRKEAAILWPFVKAFSEGKTILVKDKRLSDEEDSWSETDDCSFNIEKFDYRIKQDSKPESNTDVNYRPFANVEECWQELLKHVPFGWVKDTEANEYLNVYCISNSASSIDLFGRMFKRCIFIDGSPYGIKEEK